MISNPHVDPNTGNSYNDEVGYQLGYNNSPSDRVYGENLSWGSHTARSFNKQLFDNEKASNGGHFKNILDSWGPVMEMGAGYYKGTLAEEFHA